MSRTGREGLVFRMVTALAEQPSAGDKILILQAGMVAKLHKVVLVQFTGVLAKCTHALMLAEIILLLSHVRVIIRITCRPLPNEGCISWIRLNNNYNTKYSYDLNPA